MPATTDLGRKCQITFDVSTGGGFVAGDSPRMIIPITEDHLPDELKDLDGANPAQADGFDIAISTDEFGSNQLPIWVRRFTIANDPAAADILIYVCDDLVLDGTDSLWIWWFSETETFTEDAVDATYGAENVFNVTGAGASMFIPMDNATGAAAPQYPDYTGNGFDGTLGGGTYAKSAVGPRGVDLLDHVDSPANVVFAGTGMPTLERAGHTILGWIDSTALSGGFHPVFQGMATEGGGAAASSTWLFVQEFGSGPATQQYGTIYETVGPFFSTNTTLSPPDPGLHNVVLVVNGTTQTSFLDGVPSTPAALPGDWTDDLIPVSVETTGSFGTPGIVAGEFLVYADDAKTGSWIETYYALWDPAADISAFGTPGTVQATLVTRTVTFIGAPDNTEIRIFLLDAIGGSIQSEIDGVENSIGPDPSLTYQVQATIPVRVKMLNYDFLMVEFDTTFTTDNQTVPASALLRPDRVYENPA